MFKLEQYPDVVRRPNELGLEVPEGFTILPRNFARAESRDELIHEDTAPMVRTLLREEAGIEESKLDKGGAKIPYIKERSTEWVGTVLLFGASVFAENPELISVTLNVLSNYLTDYFRGAFGRSNVKLAIVVPERNNNKYMRINYEGDVEGLKDLNKIIKEVRNGRDSKNVRRKRT